MANYFAGKVAMVTGASSGMGEALALRLAAEGAAVALVARRRELLEQLEVVIRDSGGKALSVVADVSDRRAMFAAAAMVQERLGPIELLIANAGVGMPTHLDPVNLDDVEAMVRINLLGVIYSVSAVLPDMLARRRGHLAVVSSLGGYVGLPGESAYCATKAAVTTYFDGLRAHARSRGIAVTTLCPGFIKTAMTAANHFPMPGLMDADRAARLMLQAIARRRKVYNFPSTTTWLVRLAQWLPDGVLDRLMNDYNDGAAQSR